MILQMKRDCRRKLKVQSSLILNTTTVNCYFLSFGNAQTYIDLFYQEALVSLCQLLTSNLPSSGPTARKITYSLIWYTALFVSVLKVMSAAFQKQTIAS